MKTRLFIMFFCCFFVVSSYSNQPLLINDKSTSLAEKWWYAWGIYEKHKRKEISDLDYTQKLEKCSEEGSGYCAVYLSNFYYDKHDYPKAHSWALTALTDNSTFSKEVPSAAEKIGYALGIMYLYGQGVLQNYDKAILYLKNAAKYGDRNIAMWIARAYYLKGRSSSFIDRAENYKHSYAWFKVAQALPEEEHPLTNEDGTAINIQKILNDFVNLPINIEKTNVLAGELCSSIQNCIT